MITSLVTFKVDLNTVRDDNRISTLLKHATSVVFAIPNPGDRVNTTDEEGNRCEAEVEAVTARRIILRMDWDTWSPHVALPQLDFPSGPSHIGQGAMTAAQ